jgi:hypothetical protein
MNDEVDALIIFVAAVAVRTVFHPTRRLAGSPRGSPRRSGGCWRPSKSAVTTGVAAGLSVIILVLVVMRKVVGGLVPIEDEQYSMGFWKW